VSKTICMYGVNELLSSSVSLIVYEILCMVSLIKRYSTFFFPARQIIRFSLRRFSLMYGAQKE
jgi:hypothetical protein